MINTADFLELIDWVCHYNGSKIFILTGLEYLDNEIIYLDGCSSRFTIWIEKDDAVMAFKLRWL